MKHKSATLSIKSAGTDDGLEEGQVVAYASVFDNIDSYGDIVRKGAFAETLKEWDESGNALPLLWGHDMADPFSNIGHIVKAEEDERGLKVTGQFDLENEKARQVYRLVKGRRVSQLSFAYDVLDGAPVEADGEKAFELTRMKLYEVSLVPIGANQETEVLAVKSHAELLRKTGDQFTDEQLEAIKAANTVLSQIIEANEPDEDTADDEASTDDETKGDEAGDRKSAVVSPEVSARIRAAQMKLLTVGD